MGDETITAEEFVLAYNFGHGHLRRGSDPRSAYLDLMIRELVLSQEAVKHGLDDAAVIQNARQTLKEELLIERVFETKVLERITVTDQEIRDEVNRNAVQFAFRLLPALTEAEADRLYRLASVNGYESVIQQERERFYELGAIPDELTSPLLDVNEIDPRLLDVIQDQPIGSPTEPFFYEGYWYVAEVTDIRRRPLAPEDYEAQAETYRKVVYNRKALEMGTAFVAATMEPLDVKTKRTGFERLNSAFWDWYRHGSPSVATKPTVAAALASSLEDPLVAFGREAWDIEEFLTNFNPARYSLRADDPTSFKTRLADIVALVVRDAVFLEIAENEDLDDDPKVVRTLAQWTSSWQYLEMRRHLLESSGVESVGVRQFYEAKAAGRADTFIPFDSLDVEQREGLRWRIEQTRVDRYVDSVRSDYDVEVFDETLASLDLSASEKNPLQTVHLFKSNSNKQPFPIPDARWKWQ